MQDTEFDLHRDGLARSKHREFIQVVIELMSAAKSERACKGPLETNLKQFLFVLGTVSLTASCDVRSDGLKRGGHVSFGNIESRLPTKTSHRRP